MGQTLYGYYYRDILLSVKLALHHISNSFIIPAMTARETLEVDIEKIHQHAAEVGGISLRNPEIPQNDDSLHSVVTSLLGDPEVRTFSVMTGITEVLFNAKLVDNARQWNMDRTRFVASAIHEMRGADFVIPRTNAVQAGQFVADLPSITSQE